MLVTRLQPAVLDRWLRRAACFLSVFFVLLFLYVALRRLRYPFELDRMESGMMTSVWRITHGSQLYSAPSMEWVPFLYAPVFFFLSAALSRVTGLGYSTLRLVSILATLGSFATIYALVHRETRRHAAALLSVGLFACLYDFCLGWYDVGRVDSLSVFLFLLALYATRWTNPIIAACFWLVAFHSKQTFLPFGILAFVPLWRAPRRMFAGMGAFALMAWISVHLLNHASSGWYSHYAFGTARELVFVPRNAILFLPLDIVHPFPILVVILLVATILYPPRLRSTTTAFYGFMTVLLLGATGFVRAHTGANINAVIPAYAWLSILAGLSIHRILVWLPSSSANLSPRSIQLASTALWLGLCAQLVAHVYQPGRWIPQRANLTYRNALLDAVRSTPGDVWLVNHSYEGILAGKPVHPEMDALDAVLGLPYPPAVAEFNRLIAERHFAAILTDYAADSYSPAGTFTNSAFQISYGLRAAAPGFDQPNVLDQPQFVFLPCADLGQTAVPLLSSGTFQDASHCNAFATPAGDKTP
jgi:hypothetical protein